MTHRLLLLTSALAALLLLACGTATLVYERDAGTSPDGLARLRWANFGALYLRPEATLPHTKIELSALTIPDSAVDKTGYEVTPQVLNRIRRAYAQTFPKVIGGGRFQLVDEAGPDVLRLDAEMVRIRLYVPPDSAQAPDEYRFATSPAEYTIILNVSDSVSGESLVRAVDRRSLGSKGTQVASADAVTNLSSLRREFHNQALLLRQRLEKLQDYGPFPPLPAPGS